MNGCNVTVIGGGPAGVLSAAHFAKRGAKVTVYDKRKLETQIAPGRGWSIALGDMASHCIEDAGLSADFGDAGRLEAFMLMAGTNEPGYIQEFSTRGSDPPKDARNPLCVWDQLVTRGWIVKHLRKECAEKYPNIRFMDGYSLVGGDLHAGEAIFKPDTTTTTTTNVKNAATDKADNPVPDTQNEQEEGGKVKVTADIVIGADGGGSQTRSILQQLDGDLKVKRDYVPFSSLVFKLPLEPNQDPKTYADLETPSGLPFQLIPENWPEKVLGGMSVFVQPVKDVNPELVLFNLGCKAGGAEVTATLAASEKWWGEAQTRTVEDTMKILETAFPRVPTTWLQSCAEACCSPQRRNVQSGFVECSKLGMGRCVLIGDAAHSVSANLGYGCTASLADAMYLSSLVDGAYKTGGESADGKLANIAEHWTQERLHDAHAYTLLSKSICDFTYYRFHQDKLMFLKALPLALPYTMGLINFPGKSLFAPAPAAARGMISGSMQPTDVIKAYHASATKLGAVVLLAVAAGLGVGVQGAGFVISTVQNWPVF